MRSIWYYFYSFRLFIFLLALFKFFIYSSILLESLGNIFMKLAFLLGINLKFNKFFNQWPVISFGNALLLFLNWFHCPSIGTLIWMLKMIEVLTLNFKLNDHSLTILSNLRHLYEVMLIYSSIIHIIELFELLVKRTQNVASVNELLTCFALTELIVSSWESSVAFINKFENLKVRNLLRRYVLLVYDLEKFLSHWR